MLNDIQRIDLNLVLFCFKSKDSMDAIAPSVPLDEAIQSFGAFLWYRVIEIPLALLQPHKY